MEIKEVPIKSLKFAKYNPRIMQKHEFASLRASIRKYGIVEPIVVNSRKGHENEVIGGHMRIEAAIKESFETVPCFFISLPQQEAKLLNLALNRIHGEWDEQKLAELVHELKDIPDIKIDLSGFNTTELENLDEWQSLRPFKEKDLDLNEKSENKCPKCGHEW